jgi:quercetin dioxygenase-like cupin family protein
MRFLEPESWQDGRGYRKARLAAAEDLRQPGALVQLVTMAPGERIPPHVHAASVEVYAVLRGACRLVVNGEAHDLQTGDLLLMEPGDVHELINGEAPFELLVFKTNAATGDTAWDEG